MVLLFSFIAALAVIEIFVLLNWAQDSASVVKWHFTDRTNLASLVEVGRHWLLAELEAGSLPLPIESGDVAARNQPRDFSDVRLLRQAGENGAFLDVYNLTYDPAGIPNEAWDRATGPESFFPPLDNAFLIRAFKPKEQGPTMVLDVVFELRPLNLSPEEPGKITFVLEQKPLLWQEAWF